MKNQNAVALGRLGGLKKSPKKTGAVKKNLETAREKLKILRAGKIKKNNP